MSTDDGDRGVVIDGDRVHRPAQAWAPTIHALLQHLRGRGAPVPEPLGVTGGVETLRLLSGVAGADCWPSQAGDEGVRSTGRLLRTVHDASRGWTPPPGSRWGVSAGRPLLPTDDAVICHGDPSPWNMVWDGHTAVGLFDWDFAYPGPALQDVAYALEYLAPFRDDEEAVRWHGFDTAPDRPHRIDVFARAYGLGSTDGLVDAVIARQRLTINHVRGLAEDGLQPQGQWIDDGFLDTLEQRARWSEDHRHLLCPPSARDRFRPPP